MAECAAGLLCALRHRPILEVALPTWLMVLVVISWLLFAFVLAMPWLLRRRGIRMSRTRFGVTLVFDSADADGTTVRLLNVNGTYQSVSYVDPDLRFELACEYHRDMARVMDSVPTARQAMVIGCGGDSLPKWMVAHLPRLHVAAVEIDPAITQIARESFFLDECLDEYGHDRMDLVEADGWAYLQESPVAWDVIVNEAFTGNKPLGELGCERGARVVREHLAPGGVYLADVRGPLEGRGARPLQEACEAFAGQFAHVAVIPERPEEPRAKGNNVLVASDSQVWLPKGAMVVK